MAFASLTVGFIKKVVQNAAYTTMLKRPVAYKSAISLETLYPNSSLKLSTPSFNVDTKEKFSGFIPIEKLNITYSASSGPGGQNVNKLYLQCMLLCGYGLTFQVHTKVDLRFKPSEADWLHPEVKEKMLELHGKKLSKEGYLIIRSDVTRSQQLNLADCLQKLRALLREAAVTQKTPSPETLEKVRQRHLKAARMRVALKREEAVKRAERQPPTFVDL